MTLEVIGYWSTLEQDSLRVHTKDACLNHPHGAAVLLSGAGGTHAPHPKLDAPGDT